MPLCSFTAKLLVSLIHARLCHLPFTLKCFLIWPLYSSHYLNHFLAKVLFAKCMEPFSFFILFYFLAVFGTIVCFLLVKKMVRPSAIHSPTLTPIYSCLLSPYFWRILKFWPSLKWWIFLGVCPLLNHLLCYPKLSNCTSLSPSVFNFCHYLINSQSILLGGSSEL